MSGKIFAPHPVHKKFSACHFTIFFISKNFLNPANCLARSKNGFCSSDLVEVSTCRYRMSFQTGLLLVRAFRDVLSFVSVRDRP